MFKWLNPAKAFENDMRRISEKISDAKIALLFERLDKQDEIIKKLCTHKENSYQELKQASYSYKGSPGMDFTLRMNTQQKICKLCGHTSDITEEQYFKEMQQMCKEKLETKTKKKTTKKGKKNV